MKVELWPIERIIPYGKNARKIPQSAIDSVARSLKEFGPRQPIVVEPSGVVVVGHVRRLSAIQNGAKEFPVHVADNLTPAQLKAYRLMDNRSHEEATWEPELLKAEILELRTLDLDLDFTGFSSRELDALLRPTLDGEDDAPPLPEKAFTQPGDLWSMGENRLLCGDATKAEDTERVCDRAGAMWTDPPYGVKYVGKTKDAKTITGDDADSVEELVFDALKAVEPLLQPCAPFYIAHPAGALYLAFGRAVQRAGWRIHQNLVWVKDSMVLGHSDYHFSYEPILYGFSPGAGRPGRGKHNGSHWYGDHAQVSVFNIPRPKRSSEHPTMKPVELIERCLSNSLPRGGVLLDPFSGSGSSLIACVKTERLFRGLDIDPKYCDVAVQRWQNLTGKVAFNQDGVCFPNGTA